MLLGLFCVNKCFANIKKWKFCHIGDPQGHYAKQNKPVTKGQILYHSPRTKYLNSKKSLKESRKEVVKQ